ncbi:uncharacterized protein LOC143017891 [Oratosquilla oratoria]|uniref:uncharacterized protein LOC143017891 n=1 Tax=Oratosquilla oratoria TaxID=337810 RepID=UPI003F76408C
MSSSTDKTEIKWREYERGSWYSWRLGKVEEDEIVTPQSILKSIEKIKTKKYTLIAHVKGSEDLIYLHLVIEKRRNATRRLDKKMIRSRFKVAICHSDNIIFAHRKLTQDCQQIIMSICHCEELNVLRLMGSYPKNLLELHRGAKQKGLLEMENMKFEHNVHKQLEDMHPLDENYFPLKRKMCPEVKHANNVLGPNPKRIPHLKRATLNCASVHSSVIDGSSRENIEYRFKLICVEFRAESIFHLYHSICEHGVTDEVPVWLADLRQCGTTHRRVCYQEENS